MTLSPLQARGPLAGSVDGWRSLLGHARDERARRAVQPVSPSLAAGMLALSLTVARRAAALGEAEEVGRALAEASAWGATVGFAERMAGGTLVLGLEGENARRLPCGADSLTAPVLLDALGAAAIVRDLRAVALLSSPDLLPMVHGKSRARGEVVGSEAFWAPFGGLFAAIIRGDAVDAGAFDDCRQAVGETSDSVIDPESLRLLKLPLIDLMQSMGTVDAPTWRTLVRAAVAQFEYFYTQPDWALLDGGMLALQMTALCAVARDRFGTGIDGDLPVLPVRLVEGEAAAAAYSLGYEFPPRRAGGVQQIHWLLDLDGVPRDARQHRLIERDGRLVARYASAGWAELDEVAAEFELVDGAVSLDPGELLLVADLHARQVAAEPAADAGERQRQQAHLRQALAALDAILTHVPGGAPAVHRGAFRSARGQAVHDAEPGRFDADRLQAVRDAYRRLLDQLDRGASGRPEDSVDRGAAAGADALAAIAVIKAQLEPLVRALAADRAGDVLRTVRPRPDDYAKAFRAPLAAAAAQEFAKLWAEPLSLRHPRPEQSQLLLDLAPAGMLASDNELSNRFPGGYQTLAPHLVPHRVWARWKLVRPGETVGMAYDGLVWLDDHWAWFPKPYRVLSKYLASDHG